MEILYYSDIIYLISFLITLIAQIFVSSSYSRYKKILNSKDNTGYDTARKILDKNNLENVMILETKGNLTDHYDPKRKVIKLSTDIYHGSSIASAAVAAHECGHAIQDKEGYSFFKIRSALVPVVNFISYLGYFGLIVSLIGGLTGYVKLSILILFATVLFQLVTLPVEFNASSRGKKELDTLNLSYDNDKQGISKVLSAAAMTYVAGLLSSLLQLLRLIIILGNRDRD